MSGTTSASLQNLSPELRFHIYHHLSADSIFRFKCYRGESKPDAPHSEAAQGLLNLRRTSRLFYDDFQSLKKSSSNHWLSSTRFVFGHTYDFLDFFTSIPLSLRSQIRYAAIQRGDTAIHASSKPEAKDWMLSIPAESRDGRYGVHLEAVFELLPGLCLDRLVLCWSGTSDKMGERMIATSNGWREIWVYGSCLSLSMDPPAPREPGTEVKLYDETGAENGVRVVEGLCNALSIDELLRTTSGEPCWLNEVEYALFMNNVVCCEFDGTLQVVLRARRGDGAAYRQQKHAKTLGDRTWKALREGGLVERPMPPDFVETDEDDWRQYDEDGVFQQPLDSNW